jgi:hypothetical protein
MKNIPSVGDTESRVKIPVHVLAFVHHCCVRLGYLRLPENFTDATITNPMHSIALTTLSPSSFLLKRLYRQMQTVAGQPQRDTPGYAALRG